MQKSLHICLIRVRTRYNLSEEAVKRIFIFQMSLHIGLNHQDENPNRGVKRGRQEDAHELSQDATQYYKNITLSIGTNARIQREIQL